MRSLPTSLLTPDPKKRGFKGHLRVILSQNLASEGVINLHMRIMKEGSGLGPNEGQRGIFRICLSISKNESLQRVIGRGRNLHRVMRETSRKLRISLRHQTLICSSYKKKPLSRTEMGGRRRYFFAGQILI